MTTGRGHSPAQGCKINTEAWTKSIPNYSNTVVKKNKKSCMTIFTIFFDYYDFLNNNIYIIILLYLAINSIKIPLSTSQFGSTRL